VLFIIFDPSEVDFARGIVDLCRSLQFGVVPQTAVHFARGVYQRSLAFKAVSIAGTRVFEAIVEFEMATGFSAVPVDAPTYDEQYLKISPF